MSDLDEYDESGEEDETLEELGLFTGSKSQTVGPVHTGTSKTEAKTLFETAMKKYDAFKPESTIHPQWGKSQAQYFLSQLK